MLNHFPIDKEITYLNSGTQSIPPNSVIEEYNKLKMKGYHNPTAMHVVFPKSYFERLIEFARIINCRPKDLFFCQNVTESLNHFILGTHLAEDANIYISDLEYGAIRNICRHRCDMEKRKLQKIPLSKCFEKEPDEFFSNSEILSRIVEEVEKLDIKKGDMIVLSHIMTSTGWILPLAELTETFKDRGHIFVIDGAHAAGAIELRMENLPNVAFYGGNLHKWMMSVPGVGFGWVNPQFEDQLSPCTIGWPSFETPWHLTDFQLSGTAMKFYPKGTVDFAAIMSLKSLFNFWDLQGQSQIFQMRASLRKILMENLQDNKTISLISHQTESSPILCYKLSPKFSQLGFKIANDLAYKHNLIVATPDLLNETVLRLTPNIHNSSCEMAKASQVLNHYFQ